MYPLTGSLLLVISTSLLSIYICSAQEHVINIDAINGEDTESCLQGITPCATINMTLNGLSFNGTTTLYISPGIYTLEYGDFNNISGNVGSSFAIIGSGELETVVKCDPGAGLNFTLLYEVTIQSITFIGCGFENQLAIYFELYHSHNNSCTETIVHASPATLTFTSCQLLSVYNVTILSSNGSGIIVMDTRQASIIGCNVSLGYYLDSFSGSLAVGGIVLLSSNDYQRYGYRHRCDTSRLRKYSIAHLTITDNNYQLVNEDCRDIQAIGALVVAGAIQLELEIDSCLIANNSRALFSYHSCCNSCSYEFNSSMISNNQNASIISSYDTDYYYPTLQLNVLMIDTELIDSDPLVINLSPSTSVSSTSFSMTLFSSYIQRSEYSRVNVSISNPKLFSFDFHEVEVCRDYTNECIGYDCSNIYSFCSDKEGECSNSDRDNCHCYDNHFNETNNCGGCIKNHSVAINSPYLECVPCNSSLDIFRGWAILIVVEFIPLTIMIALIAILNVNLNQGSLKAYVLFCQLFTIPIPSSGYPSWIGLYNYTHRLRDFALLPFTIWNLGFISFPSCNLSSGGNKCSDLAICISQNTTPLGAIAFWYVIAFYPFLLLAFLFGFVIMYNKGYRCVVCTGRPVHRFLARFWRKYDIQPSFSHTVASVYLLCFTQIITTSLKIFDLGFVEDKDQTGQHIDDTERFFYDGSQKYFQKTHVVAFFAGLFVLFVFLFLPVTYLCVYPSKWFQKCFNKLKFKKDLLISVTDVFNGPYKNGTQDTLDYRYFAGLAFALQWSQLMIFNFHRFESFLLVPLFHLSFSSLFVILIVIFRPYKKLIHSLTEILFHLVLIVFSISPIFVVSERFCIENNDRVDIIWVIFISIVYFILIIVCIYCFVWIVKKWKYAASHRAPSHTKQPQQLINDNEEDSAFNTVEEDDGEFADRLMNPQSYNERHVPNMPLDNGEKLTAPYKRI